ncbi:MAG: hypothetical protein WC551_09715 [Patescibacteria group bacterium]
MAEETKAKAVDRIAKGLQTAEMALALAEETDVVGKMRRGAHKLNAAIKEIRKDDAQEKPE